MYKLCFYTGQGPINSERISNLDELRKKYLDLVGWVSIGLLINDKIIPYDEHHIYLKLSYLTIEDLIVYRMKIRRNG